MTESPTESSDAIDSVAILIEMRVCLELSFSEPWQRDVIA